MLWAKHVFTYVVGGRVGMNETCYFTFDMKKLVPTPPHPTPTPISSSVASNMYASPKNISCSVASNMFASPKNISCSVASNMYASPRNISRSVASNMYASPKNIIIPTPPHPNPPQPPKNMDSQKSAFYSYGFQAVGKNMIAIQQTTLSAYNPTVTVLPEVNTSYQSSHPLIQYDILKFTHTPSPQHHHQNNHPRVELMRAKVFLADYHYMALRNSSSWVRPAQHLRHTNGLAQHGKHHHFTEVNFFLLTSIHLLGLLDMHAPFMEIKHICI